MPAVLTCLTRYGRLFFALLLGFKKCLHFLRKNQIVIDIIYILYYNKYNRIFVRKTLKWNT